MYQYVYITWLLCTGKHLFWILFLILSIAKFLRAPILKNERLPLKMRGRSHWGGQGSMFPPHFNFQTKQGPKVLNITDIAFYGCLEIMRTRNFTIFTVYVTIVGQFMAAFHLF